MISTLVDRLRSIHTAITQVTLAALLVRLGIFVSAMLAFTVAYPPQLLLGQPLALVFVALLPTVAPRRIWPTLAILVAVVGWILSTSWYDERIALWRLLALATFLYLIHTLSALAAFLPNNAVVAPETLTRWLARALGVLLTSAVLSVVLIALAERGGHGTALVAALGGLAVALAVAALLAWLLRRR